MGDRSSGNGIREPDSRAHTSAVKRFKGLFDRGGGFAILPALFPQFETKFSAFGWDIHEGNHRLWPKK